MGWIVIAYIFGVVAGFFISRTIHHKGKTVQNDFQAPRLRKPLALTDDDIRKVINRFWEKM